MARRHCRIAGVSRPAPLAAASGWQVPRGGCSGRRAGVPDPGHRGPHPVGDKARDRGVDESATGPSAPGPNSSVRWSRAAGAATAPTGSGRARRTRPARHHAAHRRAPRALRPSEGDTATGRVGEGAVTPGVDWVIVGGESGQGRSSARRGVGPRSARSVRGRLGAVLLQAGRRRARTHLGRHRQGRGPAGVAGGPAAAVPAAAPAALTPAGLTPAATPADGPGRSAVQPPTAIQRPSNGHAMCRRRVRLPSAAAGPATEGPWVGTGRRPRLVPDYVATRAASSCTSWYDAQQPMTADASRIRFFHHRFACSRCISRLLLVSHSSPNTMIGVVSTANVLKDAPWGLRVGRVGPTARSPRRLTAGDWALAGLSASPRRRPVRSRPRSRRPR